MTTYKLEASQLVPRPIDEVFAFFSRAENLGRITPGGMGFDLRSDGHDMRDGLRARIPHSTAARHSDDMA